MGSSPLTCPFFLVDSYLGGNNSRKEAVIRALTVNIFDVFLG
ncbi:MAG: hypothetical protein ACRC2T_16160 [Thermoguttaceae bacterium]